MRLRARSGSLAVTPEVVETTAGQGRGADRRQHAGAGQVRAKRLVQLRPLDLQELLERGCVRQCRPRGSLKR